MCQQKKRGRKQAQKKSLDYMIFSTNNYEQSLFSTSSIAPDFFPVVCVFFPWFVSSQTTPNCDTLLRIVTRPRLFERTKLFYGEDVAGGGGVNIFLYFQDYLVGENTNKGGGADFVFCIDACW
jgi:hypothetical protein